MKILVGEISSYKAIVICKFIKKNYPNVRIYTYDTRSFTRRIVSKYSDKHFLVSKVDFENELQTIILSYKINYFFPVINDSLFNFWNNKANYAGSLNYLGNIESYNILNNKSLLHDLAIKLGVQVPDRYSSLDEANFPCVIKPVNLSSAKGVIYVKKAKDIQNKLQNNQIIIQQFVQGIGVGYSFYCKKGKILNGYGHKRLAEYPVSGGSSTYREGYQNNQMKEIASKIVGYLNYTGFAMFEFKLTPSNKIYLIEVNPRIWGSINQGLVNGVNYFEKILGKPNLTIHKTLVERKTYLSPLFYVSILKYVLNFKFSPLIYFLKNWKYNLPDVSLVDDTKGYFSLIFRKFF